MNSTTTNPDHKLPRAHLAEFGIRAPWLVVAAVLVLVVILGAQFPKVKFDNNPENMLRADEPVRLFHRAITEQYDLYDFVVAGVVNTTHPEGVFNVDTLTRLHQLTQELISLQPDAEGKPTVMRDGAPYHPDLSIKGKREQVLAKAFHHDPEKLFDEDGHSVIISREIIAPSVVDNIKQAERGQLKIAYLMEDAPTTEAEALVIRDDAMNNPLYKGTLVSEDGKAVGLYVPIIDKHYSHNVAGLIEQLTADWPTEDQLYITGLPVAEDTFGIEMLVQMATSAPMAGLMIFLLLLLFFRKVSLIIAPMLVAIASVVSTMGLLIGLGFDVHIMSSMIAIFLMPIAVADSVHILSEFFDRYPLFKNKAATLRHVLGHLFKPMFYTSLTTMAGFASLGLTPIPPVRVFGLHVAFGVGLAWLLSIVLVPAYVMLFVPKKSLDKLEHGTENASKKSLLDPFLARIGRAAYTHAKVVVCVALALLAVAAYGITQININDNPVNWFTKNHRIRLADKVLNKHFGGTYTAYLTFKSQQTAQAGNLVEMAKAVLQDTAPAGFSPNLDQASDENIFELLRSEAESFDAGASDSWNAIADAINYLDPEGLQAVAVAKAVNTEAGAREAERTLLLAHLAKQTGSSGEALQNNLLDFCDAQLNQGLSNQIDALEATLTAPTFKQPAVLKYIEELQNYLALNEQVGKSSSAVDALKKANYELNYDASLSAAANEEHYAIPETAAAVGQVYTQLEGMKKKDSLFHMVTRDYEAMNIWVQLTSGNNQDMGEVEKRVAAYLAENPAPVALETGWAGLTYINVVWQDKMVRGMLSSLGSSFVVVLFMMTFLFRSWIFGLLSMIPLSITIALTYGLIGLMGKDYDMPVAVLSALTLGLSIDFAIHFLQRSRELTREKGTWSEAVGEMFKEPAKAISRNAIVIAVGFTPLLLAPLAPYRTVGFFLATIMIVSWLATMFILTALATLLQKRLFTQKQDPVT